MLLGLGSALIAAVLFGAGSIVQTIAARNVPLSAGASHRLVIGLVRQPIFVVSIGLNLSGFAFHLVALRTIPLFLAQSAIAASLAVTALLAMRIFKDPLGRRDWIAVGAVCVGLAVLATSAGSVGDNQKGDGFVLGVFVALAFIATGAVVASRFHGAGATAVLGLLAGLGFSGVSVCARLLPDLQPSTVVTSLATYALGLSGGLALLIYSLALQRGTVTGATGPMIVTQTATPALIGVIWLSDEIRPGWWIPAVVSFVVTAAGAVALARFERAPDHRATTIGDASADHTGAADA
jgi:drug/metabolite transporter (DMT)-like permease